VLVLTSRCVGGFPFGLIEVKNSLQVNEDRESRPAVSQWRGPWFTVKTTELDLDSTQVNQPAHFLTFVQTRIKAISQGKLVIVDRHPLSSRETDLAKTTYADSRSVSGELALSMNPGVKVCMSATQTSGVERNTSRWIVTPHMDREAGAAVSSQSAIWKYAHNDDLVPDRVQKCTFNHELHPGAMFGFQSRKTEVEFEVLLLWSSNLNSRDSQGKRKSYYPLRLPWTKGSNPIFFNFVYQVDVLVDLEKIPDQDSWLMPEMKTDNVKREDLHASKSPTPLGRTTAIAQRYSESGQMDDIVSTDCRVVIKTAVEGRVGLAPWEITGVNTRCFATRRKAKVRLLYDRSPAGIVAGTSEGATFAKRIILRLCRMFWTSDPFTFSGATAWGTNLTAVLHRIEQLPIRPDGNASRSCFL